MKFLLLALTTFSLQKNNNIQYFKRSIFNKPITSNYFSNGLEAYNFDQMQMFHFESLNYKSKLDKYNYLTPQVLKPQDQNLSFEEQEEQLCSSITQIFDLKDTSTVPEVLKKIESLNKIYEKHPELKTLFDEQKDNPNMDGFRNQIKALSNDKLPPKVSETRSQLEQKINGMGFLKKANYAYCVSKKFKK